MSWVTHVQCWLLPLSETATFRSLRLRKTKQVVLRPQAICPEKKGRKVARTVHKMIERRCAGNASSHHADSATTWRKQTEVHRMMMKPVGPIRRREHTVFTHFRKDPNCEIFKLTKARGYGGKNHLVVWTKDKSLLKERYVAKKRSLTTESLANQHTYFRGFLEGAAKPLWDARHKYSSSL